VGSAGSSTGGDQIPTARPAGGPPVTSSSSVIIPKRVHSMMLSYFTNISTLHQATELWETADSLLLSHPAVAEFYHRLDDAFGSLHQNTCPLSNLRYFNEAIRQLRT